MLSSSHLLLRKAAVSCLRQLAQREAKEVCEYAVQLASPNDDQGFYFAARISSLQIEYLYFIADTQLCELGLPGVLFGMLDTESDPTLVGHIHDTLTSMLHVLAADSLTQWLALCKDVLTVSYGTYWSIFCFNANKSIGKFLLFMNRI